MTLNEAKKVAAIISQADNGCPICVGYLVEEAKKEFPAFQWTFHEYEDVEVSNDQK